MALRLHQFGIRAIERAGSRVLSPGEESALVKSANHPGARRTAAAGFSVVELVVSMSVMMILTAIAIPTFMRSLRTYQLNDAATRLASMLKFTRFEAVRRNTQVKFLMKASGTGYLVGTDSNGDGTLQNTEKQELIAGFATVISSGAPAPAAILTALNTSSLTTVSGDGATIAFDARGAIRVGGSVSSSVFVFYIGPINDPTPGFRAVILLPTGTTQIWSAASGGAWQKIG
jgi:type IV fimbrial biogenesis protein FimT